MTPPHPQASTSVVFAFHEAMILLTVVASSEPSRAFFDNPTEREFFPILFLFALWGAGSSLLRNWRFGMPWPNRLGVLMSGVFAGFLFALVGWGRVPPALNMFVAGIAAYWSDKALAYLAERQYGPSKKDQVDE